MSSLFVSNCATKQYFVFETISVKFSWKQLSESSFSKFVGHANLGLVNYNFSLGQIYWDLQAPGTIHEKKGGAPMNNFVFLVKKSSETMCKNFERSDQSFEC